MIYVIQKYTPVLGKWYACTREYDSKEEAISRFSDLRDMNDWARYRLVEYTTEKRVLSV